MKAEEILSYIKTPADGQKNIDKYVEFLYVLQRNRGPVLETVTLIRFEQPTIFSVLKRRFQNNRGLSMLFSLTMDYEEALNNLLRQTE